MQNSFQAPLLSRSMHIVLFCILISGCSAFSFPGVFKIDIAQGNIVTQEALDKLKPGMSRRQVLYVMGSPMLTDTYNADRWDYYLSFRNGSKPLEERHIVLYFNENQFTHYTGKIGEPLSFEKIGKPKNSSDDDSKEKKND